MLKEKRNLLKINTSKNKTKNKKQKLSKCLTEIENKELN